MATKFIFLSNNPKIEFFILENRETVNVTTCRYQQESEVQHDIQTTEVAVGEKNKVVFTFPYEYDNTYDRYSVNIDVEASVIPYRHNEFSVDVKEFDHNTVLSLVGAEVDTLHCFNFYKCVNLQKVTANTIEHDINHAFFGCKNLKTVELGTLDIEYGDDIEFNYSFLFYKCSKLELFNQSIRYLSQEEYHTLTNTLFIGDVCSLIYTFFECSSLRNLCLETNIGDQSRLCRYVNLKSLVDGCENLETLTLPRSFSESPCIYDSSSMCFRCINLSTINGLVNMRFDLSNSKDVGHMFDRCMKLEFSPSIIVKPSSELEKVRTVGIFNNCRKMNKLRIDSSSDDYRNIFSTPLLQDEEEHEEEKDALVVTFSEPSAEYNMRNGFADQKRELILTNIKCGNIVDHTNLFHNCRDVYVNKNYWQLETGYGKYGLASNYQVKYFESKFGIDVSSSSITINVDGVPRDDFFQSYLIIEDVVEENDEYIPMYATKAYHITNIDDFSKTPSAVIKTENNTHYIYSLYNGENTVRNSTFIVQYYDDCDLIERTRMYFRLNNIDSYNGNNLYRGLISSYGFEGDEVNISNDNIEIELILNNNNIVPYVKLVGVDVSTLNPLFNTTGIQIIPIESDMKLIGISDVERDSRLVTKQIEYDKESYTDCGSNLLAEVRVNKPDKTFVNKYIRLFRPSYSNGEGFTTSTTIFDQGNNFTELRNRRYYFTEYTIDARDNSDLVSSTFTDENGEVFYRYLPRIYNGDNYSYTEYQQIEIFKTDGSKTDDINTTVSDVERIRVWYTEETTNVKFTGVRIKDLHYLNIDNFSDDMSYMFSNCSYLKSMNIKDWSITPTRTDHMFENCYSLKNIDLTTFDTQNTEDMSYMFSGCTGLTDINVIGLDTRKLKDMSYMFSGCTGLSELDLSTLDTATVENMGHIFDGCTILKDVNISNWKYDFNTINPTDIFANCYIENLIIDNSDFSRSNTLYAYYVNSIPYLKTLSAKNVIFGTTCNQFFRDITNNVTLDVTDCDISLLTDMSYLFAGSSGLTSLNLTSWAVENTINMSHMFDGCTGLSTLDLMAWNTGKVENIESMFKDCVLLASMDLSTWNTVNVKNMSNFLVGTTNLKDVNIANWKYDSNVSLPTDIFNDSYVENLIIDNSDFSRSNTSYAYYVSSIPNLKTLSAKNVIFGASCNQFFRDITNFITLDVSGSDVTLLTDMSYLFAGSSSLVELDLSSWDTSNVTDMSHMFDGCTGLTELDLTTFDIVNVENMAGLFHGCSSLTTIDLPITNASKITNMSYMFYGCSGLTGYLDISSFNTNNLTNVEHMFDGCNALSNILGLDNEFGKNSVFTKVSYMFNDCQSLKLNIDFENWDVTNVTDMSYMFNNCYLIENINLAGWNTESVTDVSYMFNNCLSLFSLDLSDFDTSNVVTCTNMLKAVPPTVNWMYDGLNYTNWTLTEIQTGFEGAFPWNLVPSFCMVYTIDGDYDDPITRHIETGEHFYLPKVYRFCNEEMTETDFSYYRFNKIEILKKDGTITSNLNTKVGEVSQISLWYPRETTAIKFQGQNTFQPKIKSLLSIYQLYLIDYSYMFANCTSLTDAGMTLGYGSESMEYMFYNCIALETIDDKNTVSFYMHPTTTNTRFMFYNCRNLRGFEFYIFREDEDEEINITDATAMFYNCSGFEVLDLSCWDTRLLTSYDYMLKGVPRDVDFMYEPYINYTNFSLMEYEVSFRGLFPWIDTEPSYITYQRYIEYEVNKSSIPTNATVNEYKEICLPMINEKYDFIAVQPSYDGLFYDYNIEYFDELVDEWLLSPFEKIRVFYAEKPTSIKFNSNSGHSVSYITSMPCCEYLTDVSHMFDNCTSLTGWSQDINVFNSSIKDCSYMFNNCTLLTGIDIDAYEFSNVEYMFNNCTSLTDVDISSSSKNIKGMGCMFNGCSNLINVNMNGDYYGADCSYMFSDCTKLQNFNVGNGLKFSNTSYMFKNCTSITSLATDNWDMSNVIDMEGMFYNCTELRSLVVDSWDVRNVTNMSKLFYECFYMNLTGLETWDTSSVTDMSYMFYNNNYQSFNNDFQWNTSNVTDMSYMFYSCPLLDDTVIFRTWDTSSVTDMSYMFYSCHHIDRVYLPDWDTSNVTDMSYMFYENSNIARINLSHWDTSNVEYCNLMFYRVPENINWYYTEGDPKYTNWTLTETQTRYSGTFPWNDERS